MVLTGPGSVVEYLFLKVSGLKAESWRANKCHIFTFTDMRMLSIKLNFEEPPTNISVGVLNVVPTLRHKVDNEDPNLLLPYIEFECKETSNIERPEHLYYSTYWTINRKTAFSFERNEGIISLLEEQLQKEKISLGITVQKNIGTHSRQTRSSNVCFKHADIHMGTGDFDFRELYGTFQIYKSNDLKDKSGIKVSTRSFVDAWRRRTTDVDYLEPKCLDNVNKWTDRRYHQHCVCYCADCTEIKNTAVCSPSQYVNCTVDKNRAIELCKQQKVVCRSIQRQRRSSFSSDPIAEMRRRAALSYKVKPVAKVQTNNGTRQPHTSNVCLLNFNIHMGTGDFENTCGLCGTFRTKIYKIAVESRCLQGVL
ncbi:uncharacterized protein LOC132748210 [Ruditapes philippinarum]|uniref:uncharacterized protein LOC132748210 n=1 Tax=Ruditapes philippinarum TaxID=129788 RepID=UPI00295B6393|nr:uncharacterized protein LOC132748210 [Ruditapes philippinarum]